VTELFVSAFVTLFVVIDPPGCAPVYAGLSAHANSAQRRAMAIRACVIAGLILLGFALVGERFLTAMHIELDAFRIAGGIMVFLIALDMVFEKRTKRREERAEKIIHDHPGPEVEDVSVFPMAMPMIAGPGSIAAIMLLMGRAEGIEESLVILAALGAVMVLTLVALIAATPILRLFGDRVEAVLTRLLGVVLAALAAQFVINGIRGSFGLGT
jgi:multiple antibiotic resistance protein